jgi:hypothetical protein
MLVVGPLSRMLLVTNRVELKLLADAACLALPLAAFFAAGRLGLGAALAALIGGTLVAYAIYLAVIIVAARGRIAPPGILDAE